MLAPRTVKIGLLGYGYWGHRVARAIARVGELAVIVDPNPHCQVEAIADWGAWGAQVASEPEVAFRACDAVWIATPTDSHHHLTFSAFEHGCHVLCEKPVVLSVKDADELALEAKDLGLAFMGGHLSLYTGAHELAKASKAEGIITAIRRNPQPSLSDGSVLQGLGPHDVAAVVDLLGMPDHCLCNGTLHRVEAVLSWATGRTAIIELDWAAEARQRNFFIGDVDFATEPNLTEPLLREALTFVELCQNDDRRAEKRVEIRSVTAVLAALEEDRCRASSSLLSVN